MTSLTRLSEYRTTLANEYQELGNLEPVLRTAEWNMRAIAKQWGDRPVPSNQAAGPVAVARDAATRVQRFLDYTNLPPSDGLDHATKGARLLARVGRAGERPTVKAQQLSRDLEAAGSYLSRAASSMYSDSSRIGEGLQLIARGEEIGKLPKQIEQERVESADRSLAQLGSTLTGAEKSLEIARVGIYNLQRSKLGEQSGGTRGQYVSAQEFAGSGIPQIVNEAVWKAHEAAWDSHTAVPGSGAYDAWRELDRARGLHFSNEAKPGAPRVSLVEATASVNDMKTLADGFRREVGQQRAALDVLGRYASSHRS